MAMLRRIRVVLLPAMLLAASCSPPEPPERASRPPPAGPGLVQCGARRARFRTHLAMRLSGGSELESDAGVDIPPRSGRQEWRHDHDDDPEQRALERRKEINALREVALKEQAAEMAGGPGAAKDPGIVFGIVNSSADPSAWGQREWDAAGALQEGDPFLDMDDAASSSFEVEQSTFVRVGPSIDFATDEEHLERQEEARREGREVHNRSYECMWMTPAGLVTATTGDLEALIRRRKLEERAAEVCQRQGDRSRERE
ncbi:hypothetical protein T484DRAFT_2228481 [Baffinella frigidus]|nr:hypothetical protein T484DRAFT_2228481 [Cryptophyta sp. CCMP2293]